MHTAKVKKGPYIAGTIRVDEAGDKVRLCDTTGVKGYLTAVYYWGTGTVKAQLTENWHRGCAYSSAGGAGAAREIDMPEGKTITIRVLNQIGNGRSDAIEILTFRTITEDARGVGRTGGPHQQAVGGVLSYKRNSATAPTPPVHLGGGLSLAATAASPTGLAVASRRPPGD